MPSITLSHIKAAFAAAGDVFDGKIAPGVAAQKLHEDTGLNTSSENRSKNPVYEFRMFSITALFGSSSVDSDAAPASGSNPSRSLVDEFCSITAHSLNDGVLPGMTHEGLTRSERIEHAA